MKQYNDYRIIPGFILPVLRGSVEYCTRNQLCGWTVQKWRFSVFNGKPRGDFSTSRDQ